jgi:molybdopterin molybdotransferase
VVGRRTGQRGGIPWPEARRLAEQAEALPPVRVSLSGALGRVLAEDLRALGDLPATDNSAMDGWAVAGPPPWRVVADLPAGRLHHGLLRTGECVRIATGAAVPDGTTSVLPVEASLRDRTWIRPVESPAEPPPRTHIRFGGEEARRGDVLIPTGTLVTPPVLGLAAATGNDTLVVVPHAVVDVFVLGDELLDSGVARRGRTRDALGPQLPGWLGALGAPARSVRRLPDDLDVLTAAIVSSDATVVVTTGGTSVGPGDHLHAALARVGGHAVVDGVAVKPGHPMVLAAMPGDRWLVGLPGNPLAACVALLTLVEPLLAALHACPSRRPSTVRLDADSPGRPGDGHRLIPVRRSPAGIGELQPSCGSAMLRGLAGASGLAVVGPQGAAEGEELAYLGLPWPASQ